MRILTIVPLPALQLVNIITVNHNRVDFIFIDFLHRSSSSSTKGFLRVTENKVDLACNSFGGLRVITYFKSKKVNPPIENKRALYRTYR